MPMNTDKYQVVWLNEDTEEQGGYAAQELFTEAVISAQRLNERFPEARHEVWINRDGARVRRIWPDFVPPGGVLSL